MQEYSFSEKFFQIQPEGRIRRYQYFVRSLASAIVLGLLGYVINYGISYAVIASGRLDLAFKMVAITPGIWAILMILYLYMMYNLMIKRAYDIGWKATTLPLLIVIFSGISSIVPVLVMINVFLWNFFSMDLMGFLATFGRLLGTIGGWAFVIFGLILLFYPGKKWNNEFGKDPANTKVSFFG